MKISKETLESCIHCGLCLPACPTYLATGRESESPRGRIYAVAKSQSMDNQILLSDRAAEHLSSCLGCLGCQSACPSGVHYESILDSVRPALAARRGFMARSFMRFSFARLLPNYALLKLLAFFLGPAQKLGLDKIPALVVTLCPPLKNTLLGKISRWPMFTPGLPARKELPSSLPTSLSEQQKKDALQFFKGCVMDIFYNHVNNAAMEVLGALNEPVSLPAQTCCGALAFHAGDEDIARNLARRNIEYFSQSTCDIVVTSAGCGAMLKNYGHLFPGDSQAQDFAKRVKDFSQVVDPEKVEAFLRPADKSKNVFNEKPTIKLAYHAACHLAHAQGVRQQPQELLQILAARGLVDLVNLPEAEHCCGSAGIYNLVNTDLSLKVLERKMDCLSQSGCQEVVTANPGCLLQLEAGAKHFAVNVKVKHMAELLAESGIRQSGPGL